MEKIVESLLIVIRNEFSDAFEDVTHQLDSDHSVSIWSGLEKFLLNSAIFWNINSETDIEFDIPVLTKLKGDETSVKMIEFCIKPAGNSTDPLLMSGSFSRYSLNDRNTLYEIRGLINKLLEYDNTPNNEGFFGGLIHLFNGVIHTVEDEENNILAISLCYNIEIGKTKINIIEDINSLNNDIEYKNRLLEKILYLNRKELNLVILENNSNKKLFLDKHFTVIERYKIH